MWKTQEDLELFTSFSRSCSFIIGVSFITGSGGALLIDSCYLKEADDGAFCLQMGGVLQEGEQLSPGTELSVM